MIQLYMKHITLLAAALLAAACTVKAPAPYGPCPTPAQVEWQRMETNLFIHFGPNTFSGKEWGDGTEPEDIFNPTDMDCSQWAQVARDAGFKGVILTAKHHDGFCLWPNPVSRHTVKQSAWKNGEGDVLKDLSEACAQYGLKLGVYISPWDRFDPHYGTPEYNQVFEQTLRSALSGYGPVFEQWFDGACGEGPNGKRQEYDWPLYHKTVFELQPDAVIFGDTGPGCRWVGNEKGVAGRTSWSTYDTKGFVPGIEGPKREAKNEGVRGGEFWVPSESDVSIRPGWFWRASENEQVKSLQELLGIYYTSVGRNSLLLLNVPPDTRGRIHEADSARLLEWRRGLDRIFATDLAQGGTVKASSRRGRAFSESALLEEDYHRYWAVPDQDLTPSVTLTLPEERSFNRIVLQEYIPLGQRVAAFEVEVRKDGEWVQVAKETTIGYKRILLIPSVTADAVRIHITEADACPVLNRLALYMDDIYRP